MSVVHASSNSVQAVAWSQPEQQLYITLFGERAEDSQVHCLGADGAACVWLDRAQGLSGITFTRRGLLLGVQSSERRIVSITMGKKGPRRIETLLEDPSLSQPNDLCEAPNGDLYFTDSDFLRHARSSVYLLRQRRELIQLITEMPLPNGLVLSLDSTALYVSDSHERHWRRYPVMANGVTGPGSVFFTAPTEDRTPPNGMTIDAQGNLYLTGCGGVWVVNSEGVSLGLIPLPGFCSSVAFGGPDGKTLFISADQRVYSLRMRVSGARWTSSPTR